MNGGALLHWNLRRIRGEQSIPQERLALDASVDRVYLSAIERKLANPTIDVLDRLSATLRVPIAELFRPAGKSRSKPLKVGRRPRTKH
jgi:transcriptional regulator with XRE-family HTH domain